MSPNNNKKIRWGREKKDSEGRNTCLPTILNILGGDGAGRMIVREGVSVSHQY